MSRAQAHTRAVCLPSRRPGEARSRRDKGAPCKKHAAAKPGQPRPKPSARPPWRGVIARSEVDGWQAAPPKRSLAKPPKMPKRGPSGDLPLRRGAPGGPPEAAGEPPEAAGEPPEAAGEPPEATRGRAAEASPSSKNTTPQRKTAKLARVTQPPPSPRGRPALPFYRRTPTKTGARADLWITGAAVDNSTIRAEARR